MNQSCPSCRNSYDGVDVLRCRINGLKATPENADDCKKYEREPGSDDVHKVWFNCGWVCDIEWSRSNAAPEKV